MLFEPTLCCIVNLILRFVSRPAYQQYKFHVLKVYQLSGCSLLEGPLWPMLKQSGCDLRLGWVGRSELLVVFFFLLTHFKNACLFMEAKWDQWGFVFIY